jgi:hypothetical protein
LKPLVDFIPKPVQRGYQTWKDKWVAKQTRTMGIGPGPLDSRSTGQARWGTIQPALALVDTAQTIQKSRPLSEAFVNVSRDRIPNMIERLPIEYLMKGKTTDNHLEDAMVKDYGDQYQEKATASSMITEINAQVGKERYATVQERYGVDIMERNYGLAATTPVLGQYAPTFGWPDDWGWYWEYVDAYLFVPEAAFAVNLKTRSIWKPGYEFDTKNKSLQEKIVKEWKKLKIEQSLKWGCKNALTWGNEYLLSQDDSNSEWEEGTPADYAQGAGFSNITGAPRPLVKFTPAKKFYGLMNTDPRTFRMQIHPQRWDDIRHTVLVEKYIQRRWAGPLAPTYVLGTDTELDFHPEQCLHLAFNKITGGIYGYSMYRSVLFTLKGYLIMVQFLPSIVEKRADPLLHIKMGGDEFKAGIRETKIPSKPDFDAQVARLGARMPSEDIITDAMVSIDEVYKGRGSAERVEQYITTYKERVMMGLGIPMSVATMSGGAEIKWGTLNFELMEDEIREYQDIVENLVNEWIVPKLLLNIGGGDPDSVRFKFNEITSEDWRSDVAPLAQLYQTGIIKKQYVWTRLNIPDQDAIKGDYVPNPIPGQANKIASQPRSQGGIALSKKTKQVPQPNESWRKIRVSENKDGTVDFEKLDD